MYNGSPLVYVFLLIFRSPFKKTEIMYWIQPETQKEEERPTIPIKTSIFLLCIPDLMQVDYDFLVQDPEKQSISQYLKMTISRMEVSI